MEFRRLYITLKSAYGLKNVNLFSKMDVYAEVSIAGHPQSKKRTAVDKNSGKNPKWNKNTQMDFVVDEPSLTKPGFSILIKLKAESFFGSDKEVGSVTVPVHDLFGPDYAREKTIEYKLHTPSGRHKGSVKFSYCFGEKLPVYQVAAKNQYAPVPVTAYPMPAGVYAGMGYPPPHAGYGVYQPQTSGYGYQGPPPASYGYAPPPAGYGYGQPQRNKMGMGGGLGLGLGAGLLGGLLVGEMAADNGDAAAYADGYGGAMGMGALWRGL